MKLNYSINSQEIFEMHPKTSENRLVSGKNRWMRKCIQSSFLQTDVRFYEYWLTLLERIACRTINEFFIYFVIDQANQYSAYVSVGDFRDYASIYSSICKYNAMHSFSRTYILLCFSIMIIKQCRYHYFSSLFVIRNQNE